VIFLKIVFSLARLVASLILITGVTALFFLRLSIILFIKSLEGFGLAES